MIPFEILSRIILLNSPVVSLLSVNRKLRRKIVGLFCSIFLFLFFIKINVYWMVVTGMG